MTPKQATPFFVGKLTRLAEHLQRSLESNIERFIVVRDQAYFKTVFFSGDQPGDLGQFKTPEILRFPNDDFFYLIIFGGKHLKTVIRMCLEFEEIRKRDVPHQRDRTVYGCRETNWHQPDYQLFVPPYDHRQCSEGCTLKFRHCRSPPETIPKANES